MKVAKTIAVVRKYVQQAKKAGKSIGFVPTMGALHQGHLSLVRQAKDQCDYVVVSIFVNPTQFGPGEDFVTYPRQLNKDLSLLKKEKVDLVLTPSVEEMYLPDAATTVEVSNLSEVLEGKFRPGHFRGVCTVVLKLFNIVQPDFAYFGWKDAQQLIIVKKMVEDLNVPVKIVGCPTVRQVDGLAASSRNVYLSREQRKVAVVLYQCLQMMEEMVKSKGIKDTKKLLESGRNFVSRHPGVKLEYLEAVSIRNLQPVKKVASGVLIAGAIRIGKVRLIDNIVFS